jgi:hypothetical protein
MSEIRFSAPPSSYTLAGNSFPTANKTPQGLTLSNPHSCPVLQPGSVDQLLNLSQMRATPNAFHAAPLVNLQSHTASRITNSSTTSKNPEDSWDAWKSFRSATTGNAVIKGLTRATSRLGSGARGFGSVTGLAGAAIALPGGISDAAAAIEKARQTGSRSDVAQASALTTTAGSTGARLAKHGLETSAIGSKIVAGHLARRAGSAAFRQAVPGASKAVVKAAAKQAAKEALKETTAKLARRGVEAAAKTAAKNSSTLAKGAGVVGKAVAKKVLREGGEAAAKAAGKAVARGALKAGGKAAGRFVPGLNIAIAGLDTATAVATLADPKASTGKKVTSCITAAGSIVAATNIPVVSQIGAAVSTVSSFIGSFF